MICDTPQARLVLEEPDSVQRILDDWPTVLAGTLEKWNVKQQDLQVFFEDFRNNLLQQKEVLHQHMPWLSIDEA